MRGNFEVREKGSLVRFTYFKEAIARSTAASLDLLFRAADEGKPIDVDAMAIKGRPFQEWRLNGKDSPEVSEADRWRYGKVCLSSEMGRNFWLECLQQEYFNVAGASKTTGVCDPSAGAGCLEGAEDARVIYFVGLPALVWNGMCSDPAASDETRCARLLTYVHIMSGSSLTPDGCEAAVWEKTENSKVPLVKVAVRASVAWDRAAQGLDYRVEGPLGDLRLERKNPHRLGLGRQQHSRGGSHDVFDMDQGNVGGGGEAMMIALADSPESNRGKVDVLYDKVKREMESLSRSLEGLRDPALQRRNTIGNSEQLRRPWRTLPLPHSARRPTMGRGPRRRRC
jgi:hypothetical protein